MTALVAMILDREFYENGEPGEDPDSDALCAFLSQMGVPFEQVAGKACSDAVCSVRNPGTPSLMGLPLLVYPPLDLPWSPSSCKIKDSVACAASEAHTAAAEILAPMAAPGWQYDAFTVCSPPFFKAAQVLWWR